MVPDGSEDLSSGGDGRRRDSRSTRRRARWAVGIASVAACALGVGLVVVVTGAAPVRAHPRAVAPPTVTGSSGSGAAVPVARWSPPAPGAVGLPPGTVVTSVLRHRGELVAVGGISQPCTTTTPGACRTEHVNEPVVWTSPDGGTWQQAWDPGAVDEGQTAERLVTTPTGLLLFDGTTLWRSPDAVDWHTMTLPPTAPYYLRTLTWSNGTLLASFSAPSDGALQTSNPDLVYITRDEVHWQQVSLGPPAFVSAAAATSSGFVVAGQSGPSVAALHPAAWVSADGVRWQTVFLGGSPGSVSALAAEGTSVVARGIVNGEQWEWWSGDGGGTWSATPSAVPASTVPAVSVLDGGFLGSPNGFVELTNGPTLWWSPTGAAWQALANRDEPAPSQFPTSIEGLYTDGGGLGVLVSRATSGTLANGRAVPPGIQVWHVALVFPTATAPSRHDIRLRYTVSN